MGSEGALSPMEQAFLTTEQGRKLAYNLTPGTGPVVVFLGGLKSDKEGSKALHLESWARARGHGFLRFDYSGHGSSSGEFTDGCIGDWAEDARAMLAAVTEGPLVLVGSSMGGWQALLLARAMPERLAGLVTIAAAPDFTELMWSEFSDAERAEMMEAGQLSIPSDYGEPYIYTRRLIEDGREQRVLTAPLRVSVPVRILHGEADDVVPTKVALGLFDHLEGDDIRLDLVKGADHRFSDARCLGLITSHIEEVLGHG